MSVDFDTVPDEIVTEHAFDWPPEPLGAGGMAVVYQARDRRLPREVILKKPRTHSNLGDELAPDLRRQLEQRLASEALILAQLQHPSIVTIYEVGRSGDGAPFCVLERVEGRSLGDLLEELEAAEAEDGQPRTRERLELVSNLLAIAEALACAHERSIVHRDVTPYNILLGPRGEATLIDWGIAKDLRTQRLDDELALDEMRPEDAAALAIDRRFATICAGTPPYVSLEQAEGKPAHPSYDIYTFGATLYHVVAGRPPFQLDKLDVFLDDLRQGEPPPPASPQDPELSGIIARAMAPREDRFTANELVRALKEYLTGELVFSHRYSSTGRLVRWVRKRRSTAVALVAVVLAAVFAALTWSAMSERAQRQAREAAEARAEASEALAAAAAREREVAEAEKARAEAEKDVLDRLGASQPQAAAARPDALLVPSNVPLLLWPYRIGIEERSDPRSGEQVMRDVLASVTGTLESEGWRLGQLRPDEVIVVAVDFVARARRPGPATQDRTLIVRVRKQVLDDRHSGKIGSEEFRRAAEVVEY